MKRLALALLLTVVATPASGQDTRPLTGDVAAAVLEFYNHPTTTRVRGPARIAAGTTMEGSLASLGGPVVIAGEVRGDVVVINGDLRIVDGGRVRGSARVVGGRMDGAATAVEDGVAVYHDALRFRWEGERLVADRPVWPMPGRVTRFGRTQLMLGTDGSYNRVEGLPVSVGPRIELGHSNPTVLDARAVWRTGSGLRFDSGELGHDLRLEQYVGGHRAARAGVGLHRLVGPIEDAGISDTENSLATFILHEDHRDHYMRRGWSAYLQFIGTTRPLDVRIEYRDETHSSAEVSSPWSLLKNDSPWRAQPEVAAGDLRSLRGVVRWDSRNDRFDPAAGWLVMLDVEQGLGGTLDHGLSSVDSDFTSVSLDARRYLRLGPSSRLAVRAKAAGAPDNGPLPPQRQHVLGGEGSLPAFSRFAFDCGARAAVLTADGMVPYYGCDRMLLLQAEYRHAPLGDVGISRRLGLDFDLFATPEIVLFANAGRAWVEARAQDGRFDLGPRSLASDAGLGLRFGPLGLYVAVPLAGDGGRTNFFIRLGPRF